MTRLVDDLLLLARLDAGRPLEHETVDLTLLVLDATDDARAAGPRHHWFLDLPEEPVTVRGTPTAFSRPSATCSPTPAPTHRPAPT